MFFLDFSWIWNTFFSNHHIFLETELRRLYQDVAADFGRYVHRSRGPGRAERGTDAGTLLQDERGANKKVYGVVGERGEETTITV